jgi:hypothetical protein
MKKTLSTLAAALLVAAALDAFAQAPAPGAAVPAPQAAAAAVPVPLPTAPPVPKTVYSSVRITLEGKAAAPGAIGVEVESATVPVKRVWVRVLAKTTDSGIAEDLAKELTFALGPAYKVKTSSNRITISKENKSATPVSVTFAGLSIYGVSAKVEEY